MGGGGGFLEGSRSCGWAVGGFLWNEVGVGDGVDGCGLSGRFLWYGVGAGGLIG